jgi:Mn-dependent DtxR family transcriptional regulator
MRKRVRRDTYEGWWLKEKGPEEKEEKMKRSRIVDSGLRIEDFYRQAGTDFQLAPW